MPAAYAHYRFGQLVLSRLPAQKQKMIQAHRALYDLSLIHISEPTRPY